MAEFDKPPPGMKSSTHQTLPELLWPGTSFKAASGGDYVYVMGQHNPTVSRVVKRLVYIGYASIDDECC